MKYFVLIFFATTSAWAQNSNPEFKLKGEAEFFFELAHQPSSKQGQTRFDFALLQLSPELKIDEDLSLHFRFVLAEERSTTEKNYLNEMQNAYVKFSDQKFTKLTHELGLIRMAWITNEGSAADFNFFGDSSLSLTRRYGLVSEGDLGYQAHYQWRDNVELLLGFTNGEENKQDEQGPNKQSFFGVFYKGEKNHLYFWLSSGRVDRIESQINEKNRALFRFERRWGRLVTALEGVYAKDPSVDLENNNRLEAITFTELANPREIETTGGRLELMYDLTDKQRALLRFDQMTPQWKKKQIQSGEVGWVKRESPHMIWGLFYEKTDLGTQHSSQSKQRERARLGLEVAF